MIIHSRIYLYMFLTFTEKAALFDLLMNMCATFFILKFINIVIMQITNIATI